MLRTVTFLTAIAFLSFAKANLAKTNDDSQNRNFNLARCQILKPSCLNFLKAHGKSKDQNKKAFLYQEAFKLSVNGQYHQAAQLSHCSSLLNSGQEHWPHEIDNFWFSKELSK